MMIAPVASRFSVSGYQERDTGDGADAGQDSDDGAEEAAEESKDQVLPGHSGREAAQKFVECIHV